MGISLEIPCSVRDDYIYICVCMYVCMLSAKDLSTQPAKVADAGFVHKQGSSNDRF